MIRIGEVRVHKMKTQKKCEVNLKHKQGHVVTGEARYYY